MPIKSASSTLLLIAPLFLAGSLEAAPPKGCLEVLEVTPAQLIEHGVELQGRLDDAKVATDLQGPFLFAQSVAEDEQSDATTPAYLNGYRIEKPAREPRRRLRLRDALNAGKVYEVTIGQAALLLSPAQRITSGPPAEIPKGLNLFRAHRIPDGPVVNRKLSLRGTIGPGERTATRAVFVCLPVAEWHHDEYFPIKDAEACLVVYEVAEAKTERRISTIDQFGLNTLRAKSSNWICVPAKLAGPATGSDP